MTAGADCLHRAYLRLRKADWPSEADALADPVRGRCIRGLAAELARRPAQATKATTTGWTRPAASSTPASRRSALQPLGAWDAKRAAAGDLDDDDEYPIT
jgi:hypothetical protein